MRKNRTKSSQRSWASQVEPAPGDLRIVQAFVNTVDFKAEIEELSSPQALGRWLAQWDLLGADVKLTKTDLRRAIELREGLRALLRANSGAALDEKAVARLDRVAARARHRLRFGGDGAVRHEGAAENLDDALGRLVWIVAVAQIAGLWPRFKACGHGDCLGAFYDTSNNRSRKWCTKHCAARMSSKTYRRRHRPKSVPWGIRRSWYPRR